MKKILVAIWMALFLAVPIAHAQCPAVGGGYGSMMGFGLGSFGIFGMILGFVFWILLIVGIVYLIRYIIRGGPMDVPTMDTRDRSLRILNERYAKGEITKEEYEHMKADLANSPSGQRA